MKNEWALFVHLNEGDPFLLPTDPLLGILSHLPSFIDHSDHILRRPTAALRIAFTRFSNLAAHFLCSLHHNSFAHFNRVHSAKPFLIPPPLTQSHSLAALFCHALSTFSIKHLFATAHDSQSLPFLSLAAALIPPFDHWTPNMLAIRPDNAATHMFGSADQTPCHVHHPGCRPHSLPNFNWITHIVEPKTGIEFPGVLNHMLPKENQSSFSSEVLVGTGSRTMTIIKIKSLKVYAFGFYVHPSTICQTLGSKYASVPVADLKDRNDFYEDLLREDIGMTVRLVVNCNGMKINTVKDAFEKSLRARLVKTNPETDFKCIATFGSYFTKDIPLPVGTVIDIRRTTDGQLITEIGGNQIGAVHSRELCRAFFDMYLGEIPVSTQTKEEIGKNVASIITRC